MKKRVFLFIFQCLLLFLPSLSHLPFSHTVSLSLSLSFFLSFSISLSLSLSCSFLAFFLLFFSFLFSFLVFCFSFVACFCAFVSCKEQHQNITFKGCFHQYFSFPWLPVLVCLSTPLFLFLLFPLASAHLTLPFFAVFVLLLLIFFFVLVLCLLLLLLLLECFWCFGGLLFLLYFLVLVCMCWSLFVMFCFLVGLFFLGFAFVLFFAPFCPRGSPRISAKTATLCTTVVLQSGTFWPPLSKPIFSAIFPIF